MKKIFGVYIFSIFFTPVLIIAQPKSITPEPIYNNTAYSVEERLDDLIYRMTLEEKIDHLSPRLPGIPRLNVQGTRIMEGLHGLALSGPANWAVRGEGAAPTTTFPQAYGLAQMWDRELLEELAAWQAYEARYLAQNEMYQSAGLIVLSPIADLGRDIRWGRTEECYGEDPFLTAELVKAFVKGLQGNHPEYWKTASLMKHFLANSNENERFINSSDFDERLFREYYSYPFYKGVVEGGSRAYMAAYNKHNGIPCTVHPMLREITINEWGQNGIICTDGGGFRLLVDAHEYFDSYETAAAACIQSGINMFLDYYKPYLNQAIDDGLVTEKEIDDAVRGTLRVMLKLGLLDKSPENPYAKIGISDTLKPWLKEEARELARKATVKSIVLMKNDNQLLPFDRDEIESIAVIGPSADLVVSDWYSGTPPYTVSVLEGIKNALGDEIRIHFAASNKADSAVIAAKESDVAVVCIGNHPLSYGLGWGENHVASDGREAVDRQAISLEQEDLVRLVRKANPNTVLVLVSSFPYAINWSKEHVPAILHITQSSQELGNGLADVLFGKESPAGRLVQTWSSSIDELPPILDYNIRNGKTYMYDPHQPLFAFGHGLSYTRFEYSDFKSDRMFITEKDTVTLSVTVKNTGKVDGDEVVQVYAAFPDSNVERPRIALKGFKRIHIPAGKEKVVEIPVPAVELSIWSVEVQSFILERGKILLYGAASSEDLKESVEIIVR
jgi:beta-glucosidase